MQIVKEIKTPKAATNHQAASCTLQKLPPYTDCGTPLNLSNSASPSNVRVIIYLQAYKLAETYKVPQLKSFLLNAFIEIQVFITRTWRLILYK